MEEATTSAPDPQPATLELRRQAALALDVLHRTVRYGLGVDRTRSGPRYLAATCGPWLDRVDESQLEEREKTALVELRSDLGAWSDALAGDDRHEFLQRLDARFEPLRPLLTLAVDLPELPVRVALLPEGATTRAPSAAVPAQAAPAAPAVAEEQAPVEASPEPSRAPAGRSRRRGRGRRAAPPEAEPAGQGLATAEPADEQLRREAEPQVEPAEPVEDAEPKRDAERRKRRSSRAARPPAPPPPPRRRALRDPEGAGRALSAFFPGLAPPLHEALSAAKVLTVADLLLLPPARYDLLPRAVSPSEPLVEGQRHVLRGNVVYRLTRLAPLGRRFELLLADDQGKLTCRWVTPRDDAFRQALAPGSRVALAGMVAHEDDQAVLHEAEPVWVDSRGQGRVACYELPGVPDADLSVLLHRALDAFADLLVDPLPVDLRRRLRLLELGEALRRLHFPTHGHHRGQQRLAFDELLLYQLGRGMGRRRRQQERGTAHTVRHKLVGQILATLNRSLSDGQEIAFSEIRRDLARPRPMNRLLQGDVGVGKGFVALLCGVVVAEAREQVVFVAPDALAAEHRFLFAEPLLRGVGLVPSLLVGRPDAPQADALRRGEIHIVFTTAEVAKAWPAFRRLGLVVVEEREEYGSLPLKSLPSKGVRPDLLVLTDAPIPTSIALTVFGDMDLSLVPGNLGHGLQVSSHPWAEHLEAYRAAQSEVEAGRQAYVVLPMIGGEERFSQLELARFAEALRSEAFPGARIGVFSRLMSREERQRSYDDFRHRRVDVLLTTTIIEDGPSVPAATAMVVLEADRFELVRLHRLRAHVSQGIRRGRCMFVLGDSPDPEGARRVELLCTEEDAFRIAEIDLATRGAEALLGERAGELPRFRSVDPLEHRDLLVRARTEAFALLAESSPLSGSEHQPLRAALEESWQRWFPGKPTIGTRPPQSRGGRSGRRRRRRSRSR